MHLGNKEDRNLWGTNRGRKVKIKMAKWVSLDGEEGGP